MRKREAGQRANKHIQRENWQAVTGIIADGEVLAIAGENGVGVFLHRERDIEQLMHICRDALAMANGRRRGLRELRERTAP